ncbi:hypothetical protein ACWDTI_20570 [Gordonia sp. NPDC003424]
MLRRRLMLAFTSAAVTVALAVSAGAAVADPNIQLPGYDDGMPNCAVLNPRAVVGYIGPSNPIPARKMDEKFATPPTSTWCITSVGYSRLTFSQAYGVGFHIDEHANRKFPYNNAEMLSQIIFPARGWTMTMRVGGTERILPNAQGREFWHGTTGWGISNRSIDPFGLEVAWFMYNGATKGAATLSYRLTRPIFALLGIQFPLGFFVMSKKAFQAGITLHHLPVGLLAKEHDYAIRQDHRYSYYYVDGKLVDRLDKPPVGTHKDFSGQPVPLIGQMWLDAGYWFPLPFPQRNEGTQSAYMKRYVQGPSDQTPLTLNNFNGW